jgi:hypothetical protein
MHGRTFVFRAGVDFFVCRECDQSVVREKKRVWQSQTEVSRPHPVRSSTLRVQGRFEAEPPASHGCSPGNALMQAARRPVNYRISPDVSRRFPPGLRERPSMGCLLKKRIPFPRKGIDFDDPTFYL